MKVKKLLCIMLLAVSVVGDTRAMIPETVEMQFVQQINQDLNPVVTYKNAVTGAVLGSVELIEKDIQILTQYRDNQILTHPLLYKILEKIGKRVEVIGVEFIEEGPNYKECKVNFAFYSIVVNPDLSLNLVKVFEECKASLCSVNHLVVRFDKDIVISQVCKFNKSLDLLDISFYTQECKFIKYRYDPRLTVPIEFRNGIRHRLRRGEQFVSDFDAKFEVLGDKTSTYPLLHTIYCVGKVCNQVSYDQLNQLSRLPPTEYLLPLLNPYTMQICPYKVYDQVMHYQVLNQFRSLLVENLSYLRHPGVSF